MLRFLLGRAAYVRLDLFVFPKVFGVFLNDRISNVSKESVFYRIRFLVRNNESWVRVGFVKISLSSVQFQGIWIRNLLIIRGLEENVNYLACEPGMKNSYSRMLLIHVNLLSVFSCFSAIRVFTYPGIHGYFFQAILYCNANINRWSLRAACVNWIDCYSVLDIFINISPFYYYFY